VEGTRGHGDELETMGEAGLGFGGKGVRVPLWLQDWAFKVFTVFVVILLGFPGPSDGLRLHPIVFFSSGSGLTADSSVLTLTLAFLNFGLDFAQSFPFHAHIPTHSNENVESVPTHSNDPLLSREERLELTDLMELCTNLSQRVLDWENTKTSQAVEITKLKEMVKKLERRNKSRTPELKRLRKVGRSAQVVSSEDEGLGAQEDASKQGRKIAHLDADAEEVEVEKVVSTAEVTIASATTTTVDESLKH
ncbi:hypothetical protein Tco_1008461, partial [Tanacetum coccineum]